MSIFERIQQKEFSDNKTMTFPPSPIRLGNIDALRSIGAGATMDIIFPTLYGDIEQDTRSDGWTPTGFRVHDENISTLASLVVGLIYKVDEMTREIASLKDALLSERMKNSVGEVNDIPENLMELTEEEAKIKILQLYEQEKELDYFDIISRFNIDLELVIKICAELENEGRIEVIDEG